MQHRPKAPHKNAPLDASQARVGTEQASIHCLFLLQTPQSPGLISIILRARKHQYNTHFPDSHPQEEEQKMSEVADTPKISASGAVHVVEASPSKGPSPTNVAALNIDQSRPILKGKVKLDVGWFKFTTSRATLCRFPGTFLEVMFSVPPSWECFPSHWRYVV